MSNRLPDEYFRQTPSEPKVRSDTAGPDPIPGPLRRMQGMPLSLVIACALASFLIGFAGMRSVLLHGQEVTPTSIPSISSAQARPAVPYTGRARAVRALDVTSTCTDGAEPGNLLDAMVETIWTCPGSGVEESITFDLGKPVELVGVRLATGNPLVPQGTTKERMITAVRWTFDDGSWASQPLGGVADLPQELRFPNTETGRVTLTIVSATQPAGGVDQVSIADVEFLTTM
ncbi:discoidin domain-containing protein [Arachnia propionica]|uniref:Discoidin domain-containing protein n=1 Tax=Arachnia propionica TaxID=1750 RepID=A0A3P1T430_9ACTN|nr:discoidin domain-containing protein [Arachnia propionica]RRD04129.1 discoidin domain-containing protein [Arachnia propionica]